jgi:hypothetical protein
MCQFQPIGELTKDCTKLTKVNQMLAQEQDLIQDGFKANL